MNILFTGSFPPHPGGSGVVNGQLLEGLLGSGCRLRIVTAAMPASLGRSKIMCRRFGGAELHEYPLDRPQIEPWADGFEDAEARRQIDATVRLCDERITEDRPDLLLVGREAALWGLPELADRHDLPIVVICHAISFLLSGGAPAAMVQKVLRELEKVRLAIVPATHAAKALDERGHENILTLPNSLDTRQFSPGPKNRSLCQRLRIADDRQVVAHASNLKPVKRTQDIVASAASSVRENANLLYLIIGDGPCLSDLRSEVGRQGLDDHFRFTGWVDRDDMPDLLRLADIAVMPSAVEGLAMAYLEAMATGPVLIASDIASARDVLTDGETGFMFRVGDVNALSRLTLRVAADADLRRKVRRKARKHMENGYRLEESTQRLISTLKRVTDVQRKNWQSKTFRSDSRRQDA